MKEHAWLTIWPLPVETHVTILLVRLNLTCIRRTFIPIRGKSSFSSNYVYSILWLWEYIITYFVSVYAWAMLNFDLLSVFFISYTKILSTLLLYSYSWFITWLNYAKAILYFENSDRWHSKNIRKVLELFPKYFQNPKLTYRYY